MGTAHGDPHRPPRRHGFAREAGLRALELEAVLPGESPSHAYSGAVARLTRLHSITVAGAASALDCSAPTSRFTRRLAAEHLTRMRSVPVGYGCRQAARAGPSRHCVESRLRAPLKVPMLFDRHPLLSITYKWARRIAITVLGFTVLGVGVAMIVLPGPAIIVIPVGLGILGLEFAWARIWLKKIKERSTVLVESIRSRLP